jgi:hypothetical protein
MNIPFDTMPANARVWIYAANKVLNPQEELSIQQAGEQFVTEWTAHQQQLKAAFTILHRVFLVVAVDEHYNDVSGCGIDKSVHFMQEIDKKYNLNLFNRLQIEALVNNELVLTNKQQLAVMWQKNQVNEHTLVFNKSVQTKEQLTNSFQQTLSQSWVYEALQATKAY